MPCARPRLDSGGEGVAVHGDAEDAGVRESGAERGGVAAAFRGATRGVTACCCGVAQPCAVGAFEGAQKAARVCGVAGRKGEAALRDFGAERPDAAVVEDAAPLFAHRRVARRRV